MAPVLRSFGDWPPSVDDGLDEDTSEVLARRAQVSQGGFERTCARPLGGLPGQLRQVGRDVVQCGLEGVEPIVQPVEVRLRDDDLTLRQ